MGLIIVPFLIISLVWFAGWFIVLVTNRPKTKYIGWVLAVVILLGDVPLRYFQLKYLCEWKDNSYTINTSEPLDLFVLSEGSGCDEVCLKALLKYKIKTIEREVKTPDLRLFTEKAGWYNFYLSDHQDPNCRLYKNYSQLEGGYNLPNDKCLASHFFNREPINENHRITISNESNGIILLPYTSFSYLIKEKSTNEAVSYMQGYSMSFNWFFDYIGSLIEEPVGNEYCYGQIIYRHPDLLTDQNNNKN